MRTERLAAFSDGVIAVIITIMVLEIKPPHGGDLHALAGVAAPFLAYVLSFVYVAIYWNNHHHFFHLAERITGGVLWANLHLLFWLSLIPFATAWMDDEGNAALPTALYGAVLLMSALAWSLMQRALLQAGGTHAPLREAIGRGLKGRLSPPLYAAGIGCAFVRPWLADAFYAGVALLWLVPHSGVERRFGRDG